MSSEETFAAQMRHAIATDRAQWLSESILVCERCTKQSDDEGLLVVLKADPKVVGRFDCDGCGASVQLRARRG